MIKVPRRYLKEEKKERERYLHSLTYSDSAKILEYLVGFDVKEFHFSSDDQPYSIRKYLQKLKKEKCKGSR